MATGRFATDQAGYAAIRRHVAAYPDRAWAVKASNVYDEQLEALRLLGDRRAELSRARIQCVNRVHRLLAELVPGRSKRNMSTAQAKRSSRPSSPATWPGRPAAASPPNRSPRSLWLALAAADWPGGVGVLRGPVRGQPGGHVLLHGPGAAKVGRMLEVLALPTASP